MDINVNVRFSSTESAVKLDEILANLLRLEGKVMTTFDDILNVVRENNTLADSLIAAVDGVKKKLDEALASERLSPETQRKYDEVFQELKAQRDELIQAMEANTPQESSSAGR